MSIALVLLPLHGRMFPKVQFYLVVGAECGAVEGFAHVDCGGGGGVGDDEAVEGGERGEGVEGDGGGEEGVEGLEGGGGEGVGGVEVRY